MPGRVVNITPIREYTFSNLALNTTMEFALAERIDATQFTSADLMVRVHALTISSSAKIDVILRVDGYTPDDPSKIIEPAAALTTAVIDSNISAPELVVASKEGGLGSMVRVVLKGSQASGSQVTITATLSIDLVLKNC